MPKSQAVMGLSQSTLPNASLQELHVDSSSHEAESSLLAALLVLLLKMRTRPSHHCLFPRLVLPLFHSIFLLLCITAGSLLLCLQVLVLHGLQSPQSEQRQISSNAVSDQIGLNRPERTALDSFGKP